MQRSAVGAAESRRTSRAACAVALVIVLVAFHLHVRSRPEATGGRARIGNGLCSGTVFNGAPDAFVGASTTAPSGVRFCLPGENDTDAALRLVPPALTERLRSVAQELARTGEWEPGCRPLSFLVDAVYPSGLPPLVRWLDVGSPFGACVVPVAGAAAAGSVVAVACDAATFVSLRDSFALTRRNRESDSVNMSVFHSSDAMETTTREFLSARGAGASWAVLRLPVNGTQGSCGLSSFADAGRALLSAPEATAPNVIVVLPSVAVPVATDEGRWKSHQATQPSAVTVLPAEWTRLLAKIHRTKKWTQTCVAGVVNGSASPLQPDNRKIPRLMCPGGFIFLRR